MRSDLATFRSCVVLVSRRIREHYLFIKRPDSFESGLLPLNVTGGSVAAAVPWELC
jgi:hypothetical protein